MFSFITASRLYGDVDQFPFLVLKTPQHGDELLPRTLWKSCWNIDKLVGEHEPKIVIGSICGKFNINLISFKYC